MICQKYPNFSFSGCLFSMRQNAQASVSEYINILEICMSLIFHGKKKLYYPILIDQKGYFCPKLPYEIVMVKNKIITVKDNCPTHSVLYRYHYLLW